MACAEADHLHHVLAKVVELAIRTSAAGFACACCLHLILERGVILACDISHLSCAVNVNKVHRAVRNSLSCYHS